MDIQQNNVAVLHFNLVNQDGSTIFIRKTKLATFNLINPSEVSVPITDIGFDATLNQCWVRIPKASNATTGQYYGVLNIVDDDWGTYTTSKIKVYSVVSDADEDTKSVVFTATCLATQVTNPSGGNSPYYNATTGTWWQYSDTLKAFEDTGVGNLTQYITKNVQHLKDGTGNGSVVTCLDDEISANNTATGLCSTDFGKNNDNRGESCVALGENNYIAEGVSNATAIAGARPSLVDVFAIGDKTEGHKNIFTINKFGDISFRPDSSQERTAVLQDILDRVIKNVFYDSSKFSLTVTFYSAADNANKTKTYDLSGLKAVLKDDAVKEISVNQSTAVMTVTTINGSSQQIQLPTTSLVQSDWSTTDPSADSYILNKPTALSSFTNDSGYDTVTSVNSKLASCLPLAGGTLTGDLLFSNSGTTTKGIYGTVGDNDAWRIIGGASAPDSGWLELATGDDGTEPIYVRQYKYDDAAPGPKPYSCFRTIVRTATLLDASGNTSFPGTVTASAFSGNASSATKLNTARNIGLSGVTSTAQSFDGSANITIPITAVPGSILTGTTTISTTGNAATATKLANASTITLTGNTTGSGSFDGSANLSIATTTSYATAAGRLNTATWNWSGVGSQGAEGTVRKIATITDMRYLEIDGGNMVGNINTKGIVKISMTYIDGLIISNNSTVSTNFGYVITSTTSGRNGKVNIDLYLQERSGENYYNILVSKFVGSAISFESPSAEVIPAPAGYVAIS